MSSSSISEAEVTKFSVQSNTKGPSTLKRIDSLDSLDEDTCQDIKMSDLSLSDKEVFESTPRKRSQYAYLFDEFRDMMSDSSISEDECDGFPFLSCRIDPAILNKVYSVRVMDKIPKFPGPLVLEDDYSGIFIKPSEITESMCSSSESTSSDSPIDTQSLGNDCFQNEKDKYTG